MLNPKIVIALTNLEELCKDRKGNTQISDEQFREMIYAKAKQIVDYVEIETMEADPDFIKARQNEEKVDELENQKQKWGEGNSGSEQRDWAEEHGEL